MTLAGLEQRLRRALDGPLPGQRAQLRMAPRPRPGWYPGEIPKDARDGAGLLLVYPHEGEPHLVLTVRHANLPAHAGQVSLPGGARESGESLADAALREAEEEVGLDRRLARVLGTLTSLHIPVSGFGLHTVVAICDDRPVLKPSDGEVDRILEIPLGDLQDPSRIRIERRSLHRRARDVPYFDLEGEKVWGATAMILAEFLWILGAPPEPWRRSPAAEE